MRSSARTWRQGLLAAGLCAAGALSAWGWAGAQHIQITKAAGRAVPEEMAAFRDFSRPMVLPSIYPDLWKETDLDEPPRHFFEPDRLPAGLDLRALNPLQSVALQQMNVRAEEIGLAPWIICDLLAKMTSAMRTNDWLWAARCGATMAHYVGDLHMPLHCTRNYNGQETGQLGVHTRWEGDMTKAFFRPEAMVLSPAVYLDDPFRATLGWVADSFALAPDVLRADIIAKRSAGGREDSETYYLKLWELTGELVNVRISAAASDLSSLWYTAWVNAGRPAIPAPFEDLPPYSVFSGVGIDPPELDGPHSQRQKEKFDLIVWIVMGVLAVVVIGSSLHRGYLARKNVGK